jgi:hypothetical protein
VFREFIYAMFTDYKRMSLAAIANNTTMNYQKLQYFFSESNWSSTELNDIRVRLLKNQRTTKANNKGASLYPDILAKWNKILIYKKGVFRRSFHFSFHPRE